MNDAGSLGRRDSAGKDLEVGNSLRRCSLGRWGAAGHIQGSW